MSDVHSKLFFTRKSAAFVALLSFFLSFVVIFFAAGAKNDERSATERLPKGYDSSELVEKQSTLPGSKVLPAIVVISREDGGVFRQKDTTTARTLPTLLEKFAFEGSKVAGPIPSSSSKVFLVTVPLENTSDAKILGKKVDDIASLTQKTFGLGIDVAITGPAGIKRDIAKSFAGANVTLLAVTSLVVALLLIITYRSALLWIIPLLVIGVADRLASVLGVPIALAFGVPVDESSTGILSVLVFGAGTDYALLLISRYRDELRLRSDRFVAMTHAVRGVFDAIVGSAVTVILALLTLILSLFPATRGLGVVCAIGILIALLFALIVLPCALVLFGRRIFWPIVPQVGDPLTGDRHGVWSRIGNFTAKNPAKMILLSLAVTTIFASGLIGVKSGLSSEETFVNKPPSLVASAVILREFGVGLTQPVDVMSPLGDVSDVRRTLSAREDVSRVMPGAQNESIALTQVVLKAKPGSAEAETAIRSIRAEFEDQKNVLVGGIQAQEIDSAAAAERDRLLIFPLILLIVCIILIFMLRALVAPILLVLTVIVSYFAAIGAGWFIFDRFFGFPALDTSVPLLAFLFLVALGVDYNIFLVSLAKKESETWGSRKAMLRALTSTGGVITSAGILLASVFAVLGVLPVIALTQIGVIVGIGILLDTLLVRTIFVPALAFVLGDRFWLPRKTIVKTQNALHAENAVSYEKGV